MNELFSWALALMAGLGLGAFYFGGLWWTVQRVPTARRPVLLSLGSFAGRIALILLGFLLVAQGEWTRLAACLLGFLASRGVLIYLWRPRKEPIAGGERAWN